MVNLGLLCIVNTRPVNTVICSSSVTGIHLNMQKTTTATTKQLVEIGGNSAKVVFGETSATLMVQSHIHGVVTALPRIAPNHPESPRCYKSYQIVVLVVLPGS